ncbi:TonB-dependent receptor [Hyphomonas sp. FCG-A18]|uniref:TonB-dependent receptor n=1 Tax=Hyphomonas sp. FCG-A18 TaxID=3080019 RepID=UPI002B2C8434|nr:TonB-dependent receptor [Hyphomonas sp. FCG-A18]
MKKNMVGLKAALTFSVGFGALMAGSLGTVAAQDTSDEQEVRTLNTVTITATKREQTLQDVPIAVSVVDDTVIEQAQINDILDLQSVVPSLRVSQLQQSGNSTFIIRGFGNGGNNLGIEPSVAVFIDGVYRTRAAGGLSDYADIERVEVLRGPQSTLFGKNASVGVINVVTEEPQFEFGGSVEGTLGNYDQKIIKGSITGPISDEVAFSLSGSHNTRDGYVDNLGTGSTLNDRNRYALKGQLLYEPSSDFSIRLIADYDKLDEVCCYAPNVFNGPTSAVISALGGEVISNPFGYTADTDLDPVNEISNGGLSAEVNLETGLGTLTYIGSIRGQELMSNADADFTNARLISSNLLDYTIDTYTHELRLAGGTDKLDYLVGAFYFDETLDLQSDVLFGPQFYDYANISAQGAIPALEALLGFAPRTFFAEGDGSRETFTQDNQSYSLFGQLDYQVTDRLTATFGLAYINDEKEVTGQVNNSDLFSSLDLAAEFDDPTVVSALAPGLAGATFTEIVFTQAYATVTGNPFDAADFGALQAAAGGGDATAIATLQGIQATAANPAFIQGVQTATAAAFAGGFEALQFLPGFVDFPNAVENGSTNDDKVTVTARLAYDVNDNINVYGSYATGYKASSWNLTRDSSFFAADAGALGAAGLIPPNRLSGTRFAGPEETEVFEIGAKLSYSNFNLNLALFDQTIEGFQSTIFSGTGFVLANAGEQSTMGVEFDATWFPIDQVQLTFAGLLQDPEYDDFQNAPVATGGELDLADGVEDGIGDLTGQQPGGIAETSLFFGAQYNHDFNDTMSGFIRADYVYESDVQVVDNIPGLNREVGTMNASFGVAWDNGLDVTVWGRNINDDEYFTSGFPTTAQPGSVNTYASQPATYGITVRKNF